MRIEDSIFNKTNIPLLKKIADLSSSRHKLISNNIANSTTPEYQRQDIEFKKELANFCDKTELKIKTTDPKHLPLATKEESFPEIIEDKSSVNASGVNNVDIDKEMAELAKNQLWFNFASRFLARNFNALKLAIRGRIQ